MSERERAEGPIAQFSTPSVENSRTLLIRFFVCVTDIAMPITQEPDILESSSLRYFVALNHTEFVFISDFGKCVRRRAEG